MAIFLGYRSIVPGSITGDTRYSEKHWVWMSYLQEEVAAPV
jgi:hypothetical protein